ncbi:MULTISPECIES: SDR family NAD(P)-dependent oxidoreductase [Cyanophyceae]|uniref:SDR family NAD(P)-dependent oxidoreductase n=1 Tax=Leptolyngbya subtilissima DQ-A4 TaxID=2933933 RepID=A0ABV0JYR2_9CYAN|nr:SDR family NAD(P)-dependent oxidoreductase [Nodosilinea sp. FACHB-141]MBD2112026.1 SDR family NAD(P)-dependent oxidoreductase [Nodosilinea sp. FACHB-141]
MSAELQNDRQIALVVGASQGIGLGFVRQLLADGRFERVYGTYRRPETAQELLALAEQSPQLVCLPVDVTDEGTIEGAIAHIQTLTPRLHRAVYCVGVLHDGDFQPEKSLRQLTSENLMRSFQTNAFGAVLLAKHLMPLLKHDQPSILAAVSAKVGSIGDNRLGGWYGYRASKAALNMFIKTASLEYARRSPNTTLALLHPGTTDTRLSEPFQRGVPPEKLFSVERTVAQLMAVMDGLTPADSGEFFSWDGSRLPW